MKFTNMTPLHAEYGELMLQKEVVEMRIKNCRAKIAALMNKQKAEANKKKEVKKEKT